MRLLCLLLLIAPAALQAQFTYTSDHSVPVRDLQGNAMRLPWAGGLNAAQFNTMDLNGDGVDDLVLYDRMANKVITFIANDKSYVPAPDYEGFFPAETYNWILLRDFNCDGMKDLFTGDVLGMKVFINTTTTAGDLQWEPYLFNTGFGSKSQVLLTKNPATGIRNNLQLQFDDLPSISDIDGDGDLDILNIQYAGHTVEFHQNMTMENYQSCDSLDFLRVTRSWGSFRECDCGSFAFNDAACPNSGRTKHAGGKSLLAIDLDGNGQQDVLFSESECRRLYALPNRGTGTNPLINSFYPFPPSNPVDFVLFPAAFHEDVDFDGKKDLIATPNIFSKEFLNSQLNHSTWYYKNTGTNQTPAFTFVQNNFLQGEMIDVGDNAVPALIDYNADGLLDLVVSSHSSEQFTSRLYLFENKGSASTPSFKLVNDDYLGFTTALYYNVKIQFADFDSNQTLDLVFTATSFENGVTSLYYLTNKSLTSLDFSSADLRRVNFPLTSTENVYVIDINGDGLPDILAGRSEGNLEYWRNTGSPGSPSFAMEAENYLGIVSSPLRQNLGIAAADLDGDGATDLLVGSHNGRLGIISDFRNVSLSDDVIQYDLVFNSLVNTYTQRNLGGKIWPVVANLFNADKPAIVVGNALGGVHILRNDEGTSLPPFPQIDIYPNPVSTDEMLNIKVDRLGTVQIISSIGQTLSSPVHMRPNETYPYSVSSLAAGLYLLKFTSNNRSHVKRFVVR